MKLSKIHHFCLYWISYHRLVEMSSISSYEVPVISVTWSVCNSGIWLVILAFLFNHQLRGRFLLDYIHGLTDPPLSKSAYDHSYLQLIIFSPQFLQHTLIPRNLLLMVGFLLPQQMYGSHHGHYMWMNHTWEVAEIVNSLLFLLPLFDHQVIQSCIEKDLPRMLVDSTSTISLRISSITLLFYSRILWTRLRSYSIWSGVRTGTPRDML